MITIVTAVTNDEMDELGVVHMKMLLNHKVSQYCQVLIHSPETERAHGILGHKVLN